MRLGLTFAERRVGSVECAAPYPNAASYSATISVTTAARSFGTSSLTTASMSVIAWLQQLRIQSSWFGPHRAVGRLDACWMHSRRRRMYFWCLTVSQFKCKFCPNESPIFLPANSRSLGPRCWSVPQDCSPTSVSRFSALLKELRSASCDFA